MMRVLLACLLAAPLAAAQDDPKAEIGKPVKDHHRPSLSLVDIKHRTVFRRSKRPGRRGLVGGGAGRNKQSARREYDGEQRAEVTHRVRCEAAAALPVAAARSAHSPLRWRP